MLSVNCCLKSVCSIAMCGHHLELLAWGFMCRLPLGSQLIQAIMFLLFTPGFTVDPSQYESWRSQMEEHKLAAAEAEAKRAAQAGEARSPAQRSTTSGGDVEATPATEDTHTDTDDSVVEEGASEGNAEDDDEEGEDDGSGSEAEPVAGDPLTTSVWSALLW